MLERGDKMTSSGLEQKKLEKKMIKKKGAQSCARKDLA